MEDKNIKLFKWGMAAVACILIVCVILFPLVKNERNEQTAGDLAPMVFIDGTLYKASADQTAFSKQKEEFEYLGEITDEVDPSMIPKKDFQANDFIKGAEVYLYNDDIVVQIGGKYWLYESYEETASAAAADYPMLIMIGGQLYHDRGRSLQIRILMMRKRMEQFFLPAAGNLQKMISRILVRDTDTGLARETLS